MAIVLFAVLKISLRNSFLISLSHTGTLNFGETLPILYSVRKPFASYVLSSIVRYEYASVIRFSAFKVCANELFAAIEAKSRVTIVYRWRFDMRFNDK